MDNLIQTTLYSGDQEYNDASPNDRIFDDWNDTNTPGYDKTTDYEILTIDEVNEDIFISFPGNGATMFKMYWTPSKNQDVTPEETKPNDKIIDIQTQDKAQKALVRIDEAIVKKDKIRAHLGAMQNRLENTVTNLNIQAENLQAAESRISDVDVATEMTNFVRNQILTQSAVAMLSQANSLPQMAMQLIGG